MSDISNRPEFEIPDSALVLPLRNAVLFPMMKMPISVGRPRSVSSVIRVGENGMLVIVTQKDKSVDEPRFHDLYPHAVLAKVEKIQRMPDGTLTVLVHGLARVLMEDEVPDTDSKDEPALKARVKRIPCAASRSRCGVRILR